MRRAGPGARGALPATRLAMALLGGCAAAPPHPVNAPAAPPRYTAVALPAATVAGGPEAADRAQRFVAGAAVPPAWWRDFGSAELDALVERALAHNPTLAAAEASLRAAQELAAAQRAALQPTLDAEVAATRAGTPAALASPLSSGASLYTLHTAQLSVGYTVDVFGGLRSAARAQEAQAEAEAWQLLAARLALAANVATAALQEASLREQLAVTESLVAIAERQWRLLGVQRELGAAAGASVRAQEALWRQTEAAAAVLRRQLAQQRDLLAVLVGEMPATQPAPTLALAALRLPDVPLALPGTLLAQRPDVRAAEALVGAADAEVGAAAAALLPQLSLGAGIGASAATPGRLFGAGGLAWNLAANVGAPLLHGGALRHRERAAEAQLDAALAQYRVTVLAAYQSVADALEAVRHDAEWQRAATAQAGAALAVLRATERQLELGDIGTLSLLAARSAALQAELAAVQARAGRASDTVGVYQALGGGWTEPLP